MEDETIPLRSVWIGIQGGTCAGKTTLSYALAKELGAADTLVMSLDLFYYPFDEKAGKESITTNFDDPSSINWQLVEQAVARLRSGNPITIPVYDSRFASDSLELDPQKYTIVEGLWAFHKKFLLDVFDLCVYIDTPPDIRLVRRLNRDVIMARQWTLDQALTYYTQCIRPMHMKLIEPGKAIAQVIVSGESPVEEGVSLVIQKLTSSLSTNFN